MKSKHKFVKLLNHLHKQQNAPQVMAEKQSPQAPASPDMSPEDTAEQIVQKRKQLKQAKMPVKAGNLYDEL